MKIIMVILLAMSVACFTGCGSKLEGRYKNQDGYSIVLGSNGKATFLTNDNPPTEEALRYSVVGNKLTITGQINALFHKETAEFTVMDDGSLKESDGALLFVPIKY